VNKSYSAAQADYLKEVLSSGLMESVLSDEYIDEALKQYDARIEDEQLQSAYKQVFMGSNAGKQVLIDLLGYSGFLNLSFTGNSKGYFLEGKRSVGKRIFDAVFSKFKALDGE
jgi:hypothetical protein